MNSTLAARAYAAAQGLGKEAGGVKSGNVLQDTGNFGELVKAAVNETMETGRAAEAKMAGLVTGKADIVDVVTAVAETEVAVETLVQVRDKVISAYQEIMNMPI